MDYFQMIQQAIQDIEYRIVEREPITLLARVEQFPSEAITDP